MKISAMLEMSSGSLVARDQQTPQWPRHMHIDSYLMESLRPFVRTRAEFSTVYSWRFVFCLSSDSYDNNVCTEEYGRHALVRGSARSTVVIVAASIMLCTWRYLDITYGRFSFLLWWAGPQPQPRTNSHGYLVTMGVDSWAPRAVRRRLRVGSARVCHGMRFWGIRRRKKNMFHGKVWSLLRTLLRGRWLSGPDFRFKIIVFSCIW